MTRSENMEHVEVLRDLSEVCRAAIKAGDWKVDGACDPESLLRHADAAIASLSAPKSGDWAHAAARLREPAGVGAFDAAVAAELPRVSHVEYNSHEICKHFAAKVRERIAAAPQPPASEVSSGDKRLIPPVKPPAEAQPVVGYQRALELIGDAYNAGTHGIGYSQQTSDLFDARTAPPSAPVGVDVITDEQIQGLWIAACADSPSAPGWSRHLRFARSVFALAQQPAACTRCGGEGEVASTDPYAETEPCPECKPNQQPAAVDEALSHADLCRLSRVFNAHNVPGLGQDRRINDWLGKRIAAALAAQQGGE